MGIRWNQNSAQIELSHPTPLYVKQNLWLSVSIAYSHKKKKRRKDWNLNLDLILLI